jgi:hypothetical protein
MLGASRRVSRFTGAGPDTEHAHKCRGTGGINLHLGGAWVRVFVWISAERLWQSGGAKKTEPIAAAKLDGLHERGAPSPRRTAP